ncbi:2-oxo acid dehydrogenase subunit E2 [Micromonospora rifamycinica]|uniref:2-oxo acid dehydrogenase subunit E2 n=1 Tax=Micromonospora rifamycinica TaxID=291594 RepID=UPI003416D2BF
MGRGSPVAPERRHTLLFLAYARSFSPVFLDTEVDMSVVAGHRAAARAAGRRTSWVTYVLWAAGRVLAAHPAANAALTGRVRPRVARYDGVHAKLTLDKRLRGQRVVLSAVLPDVQASGLDEIQRWVDHLREGDPATLPEFAGARAVQRLPWPIRPMAFRLAARSLRRRPRLMGTVAVTSLGGTAVDGFQSVGGTTVTLGVGRVLNRPVVRAGSVEVAPVLRLSLTFDHRVIDGAEAAEILTDLKRTLETPVETGPQSPATGRAGSQGGLMS